METGRVIYEDTDQYIPVELPVEDIHEIIRMKRECVEEQCIRVLTDKGDEVELPVSSLYILQ